MWFYIQTTSYHKIITSAVQIKFLYGIFLPVEYQPSFLCSWKATPACSSSFNTGLYISAVVGMYKPVCLIFPPRIGLAAMPSGKPTVLAITVRKLFSPFTTRELFYLRRFAIFLIPYFIQHYNHVFVVGPEAEFLFNRKLKNICSTAQPFIHFCFIIIQSQEEKLF